MSLSNQEILSEFIERLDQGFELLEVIFDKQGNVEDFVFLKVNPTYEKQTGIRAADIIGKRKKQCAPTSEQRWYDYATEAVKTRKTLSYEYYNNIVKGTFETQFIPISPDKIAVLFKNVTERKVLERQVKESERLAAIGATAGMVGHDIRNPLQAILSDLYLLKEELTPLSGDKNEGVFESLDSIEKNIGYINKIVADLQDYSRPLKPEIVEVTDLCEVIDGFLKNVDIPSNIKVTQSCNIKNIKLKIELTFFKRILTNLTMNAIQAMPDGGKISITTCKKEQNLIVTVEDTGVGIPEDVKLKLFTPMMTTKAKGQGLGLSVVKRLVETLGGTINFESQVGKGTKFIIELPLRTQEETTKKARLN